MPFIIPHYAERRQEKSANTANKIRHQIKREFRWRLMLLISNTWQLSSLSHASAPISQRRASSQAAVAAAAELLSPSQTWAWFNSRWQVHARCVLRLVYCTRARPNEKSAKLGAPPCRIKGRLYSERVARTRPKFWITERERGHVLSAQKATLGRKSLMATFSAARNEPLE